MLEIILGILNTLWHIIQYAWDGLTWFLHMEERLLIIFDGWGWATWFQVLIISPINAVVIVWDIFFFYNLTKIKKFFRLAIIWVNKKIPIAVRQVLKNVWLKIKTKLPDKLQNVGDDQLSRLKLFVSRGKSFGVVELGLLALIPECQKVACFIFATNPRYFAWKGYSVLCLVGTIRLTFTAYLPMEAIWALIVLAIGYRLLHFILHRKKNLVTTDNTKKEVEI